MLEKIASHPFVFGCFAVAIVVLHLGAAVRVRHDRNLKRRNHGERRGSVRILPNLPWSARNRRN